MGGRGANSGIKSNPEKQLVKMSKDGTMPSAVTLGGTTEGYNEAFELINKYYKMPSKEYMRSHGVRIEESASVYRNALTGENELVRRVFVGDNLNLVTSPLESTRGARSGALKFLLYGMLERAGKLDKKEFQR